MVGTVAKWKKYVSSGGLQSQNQKLYKQACLAVQWLRICLAMQGTLVRFLVCQAPLLPPEVMGMGWCQQTSVIVIYTEALK